MANWDDICNEALADPVFFENLIKDYCGALKIKSMSADDAALQALLDYSFQGVWIAENEHGKAIQHKTDAILSHSSGAKTSTDFASFIVQGLGRWKR